MTTVSFFPSKSLLTFNWQPAAQMTETKTDGSTVFSISVMMALFCFRLYWCLVHITFILPSRLSIFPKLMWPFCDISWHPRALGNFLYVHLFDLVTRGVLQLSPWHLDHSIPLVVTLQYLMRDSWGWNAHPSVSSTIHFEDSWGSCILRFRVTDWWVSRHALGYFNAVYTREIKFVKEDNALNGQSGLAESSFHERSSVMRGNCCQPHSSILSELQSIS